MNINSKITMYFITIIASCISFNLYIWINCEDFILIITSTIFSGVIIVSSIVFMYILKKHMEYILNQLSKVISSIIDMKEVEVFSVLNDDMLSKLQSQVIKLTNILKSQNIRIKRDRDEIKSLISDISHQLKTPLANLRLYYELLQDTSISKEEYFEFSENMKSQIEKLSFLIENMIKMSRLESGIIRLISRKTSLNDVCLTSIKQIYQKAKDKNIEIKFNQSEDIILNIDRNWVVEAIFNIMDNAVKYTKNYGIIVVDILRYEMFVRIDISDNGIGIDEKEINNIFKRFYRGECAQDEDGLGIGLYLARDIVEKQNGYIKVKSKNLQGSTFSIFLSLD